MSLIITICASARYTYAQVAQSRRLQAAIRHAKIPVSLIYVSDQSEECVNVAKMHEKTLGCKVHHVQLDLNDGHDNYDFPAQLVIARMRSEAFTLARYLSPAYCLSMDADVLPQVNSIACMIDALKFDNGYYSIAACPYPSQGGGDFLNGRGTPQNPILPDRFDDEYIIPPELKERVQKHQELLVELKGEDNEAWRKERSDIAEEYKKHRPKGDVFFLQSITGVQPFIEELRKRMPDDEKLKAILDEMGEDWKPRGFRRRGWHSQAYPGIGKGAIVPSDWCGFGCTMMNAEALNQAQFDGYDGGGTEDLYICWKRWHRVGMRIASVCHSPCDHVVRDKEKGGYVLYQAFHEQGIEEYQGHLRCEPRPWFQQTQGEVALRTKKPKPGPTGDSEAAPAAQA